MAAPALAGAAYLATLASVSTTFVGFSALLMVFRQTVGGGLTRLDSWITLVFIQLGFLVTAGSLTPHVLWLCGVPEPWVWRACSAVLCALVAAFAVSYPARRHAVSRRGTPTYVWLDLVLLAACIGVLGANAWGWPGAPGPGGFAFGLTGVLFVAGLGYLHALGALHEQAPPALPPQD